MKNFTCLCFMLPSGVKWGQQPDLYPSWCSNPIWYPINDLVLNPQPDIPSPIWYSVYHLVSDSQPGTPCLVPIPVWWPIHVWYPIPDRGIPRQNLWAPNLSPVPVLPHPWLPNLAPAPILLDPPSVSHSYLAPVY